MLGAAEEGRGVGVGHGLGVRKVGGVNQRSCRLSSRRMRRQLALRCSTP